MGILFYFTLFISEIKLKYMRNSEGREKVKDG